MMHKKRESLIFLRDKRQDQVKSKAREELNFICVARVNDKRNHVPLGILGADLGESNQLENDVWHKVRGARKKRFHSNEKICSPKD